jgi:hypothetical protein
MFTILVQACDASRRAPRSGLLLPSLESAGRQHIDHVDANTVACGQVTRASGLGAESEARRTLL